MAIRKFIAKKPGRCPYCRDGFELWLPEKTDLEECPKCGTSVIMEVVSTVNSPAIMKPVSTSDAKASGFTIYKKIGKGEYERQ